MVENGRSTEESFEALVVEDDADIRELLVHLLESRGIKCTGSPDAETALALTDSHEFDIVVTDIQLPGMNGAELGWRVKETRPETPVVAVTAYLGAWDREDLDDLGFDATLGKPIQIAEFIDTCFRALKRETESGPSLDLDIEDRDGN